MTGASVPEEGSFRGVGFLGMGVLKFMGTNVIENGKGGAAESIGDSLVRS
jgi:hypothetical protein